MMLKLTLCVAAAMLAAGAQSHTAAAMLAAGAHSHTASFVGGAGGEVGLRLAANDAQVIGDASRRHCGAGVERVPTSLRLRGGAEIGKGDKRWIVENRQVSTLKPRVE